MNESKHLHHGEGIADGQHIPHDEPGPYWRRAHRDWRVWVAFLFCLAAITMYVLTDNLDLHFARH
jgi:hypothetical protein